jgi:hypothetical protein
MLQEKRLGRDSDKLSSGQVQLEVLVNENSPAFLTSVQILASDVDLQTLVCRNFHFHNRATFWGTIILSL